MDEQTQPVQELTHAQSFSICFALLVLMGISYLLAMMFA